MKKQMTKLGKICNIRRKERYVEQREIFDNKKSSECCNRNGKEIMNIQIAEEEIHRTSVHSDKYLTSQ